MWNKQYKTIKNIHASQKENKNKKQQHAFTTSGSYFKYIFPCNNEDRRGRDRMVVGLQLPMQSVPITTKVVRSNPPQVYTIQLYVVKLSVTLTI